jgi:hypothetical protein
MSETQITIRVDRDLYRQFKAGCILHDTVPTQMISALIRGQVTRWDFKVVELRHAPSCACWDEAEAPCTCAQGLEV